MSELTLQSIETVSINKNDYKDLVSELLEATVHGNNSPLNDMMDRFEAYLDKAVDLDTTQKEASYAELLKSTYSEINRQAMQSALDLLKTNEELKLKRYEVEASYNKVLQDTKNALEENAFIATRALKEEEERLLMKEKIKESKLAQAQTKTELELQWGKLVNVDTGVLTNATTESIVKKQIRGYDMVNYKDVLKTLDEKASLMQNAKVPESEADKELRAEVIRAILKGEAFTDNVMGVKYRKDSGVFAAANGIVGDL